MKIQWHAAFFCFVASWIHVGADAAETVPDVIQFDVDSATGKINIRVQDKAIVIPVTGPAKCFKTLDPCPNRNKAVVDFRSVANVKPPIEIGDYKLNFKLDPLKTRNPTERPTLMIELSNERPSAVASPVKLWEPPKDSMIRWKLDDSGSKMAASAQENIWKIDTVFDVIPVIGGSACVIEVPCKVGTK